jgi:uncharacterized membrane protein YraQ (UPF0718 family)
MNFFLNFVIHLKNYISEIIIILPIGFLLSGIFYEFIPQSIVKKYLVKKNFFTLLSIILIGMILPICCIGSLPMAVGFRQKGVKLGNVLAFLVATPATSITAVLLTLKFFGVYFTIYLCVSVLILGFVIGILGNIFDKKEEGLNNASNPTGIDFLTQFLPKKTFFEKVKSAVYYAFVYLPKEIGLEILIGLLLASFISSLNIFKIFVENYLSGVYGYLFSVIFGVLMYICSTASVPLVYALNQQGLSIGSSLVLLILGPLTSYATLLVVRKEFGNKVLIFYLTTIVIFSVISGYVLELIW